MEKYKNGSKSRHNVYNIIWIFCLIWFRFLTVFGGETKDWQCWGFIPHYTRCIIYFFHVFNLSSYHKKLTIINILKGVKLFCYYLLIYFTRATNKTKTLQAIAFRLKTFCLGQGFKSHKGNSWCLNRSDKWVCLQISIALQGDKIISILQIGVDYLPSLWSLDSPHYGSNIFPWPVLTHYSHLWGLCFNLWEFSFFKMYS